MAGNQQATMATGTGGSAGGGSVTATTPTVPDIDLNPVIPADVILELNRRADAVELKETAWMYKKYAYINISTTGNTQTALCPIEWSIGSAPTGSHMNLYTSEGGIRKIKPTITSVKMVNDGGQDYTDSYIWTIEFAFKVFTLADLDNAEASFFKVGSEVAFEFGWMGTHIRDGVNNTPSTKPMLANVYNFSFSIEDDGGFNCNVKCMSPNGLWSKESMGDVEPVDDKTADPPEPNFSSYLDALKTAFGIAFGGGTTEVTAKDAVGRTNQNLLKSITGDVTVGAKTWTAPFWTAEIVSKHGWGIMGDTEAYYAYTNLETLITYINNKLIDGRSSYRYQISKDEGRDIHPIYEIASADPTKVILPGDYSIYTDKPGAGEEFDFSQSSLGTSSTKDKISDILISIDYMNDVYLKLSDASTGKSGGQKAPPTISSFLKKIFNDIDQLTGGLVSIISMPSNTDQSTGVAAHPGNPSTSIIANKRKTVDTTESIKPYEFEILSKRSITKSVSLASDFEADTLMQASVNSVDNGKSNFGALKKLYDDCGTLGGTATTAVAPSGAPFVAPTPAGPALPAGGLANAAKTITMDDCKKAKAKYINGYTDPMLASTQDLFRTYLAQLVAKGDDKVKGSQFTEVMWMLKLSVTIDGIFGIPFLAPITVDRLPKSYRTISPDPVKAYFSVTSIEHSFDGQGGWETALDTVMRIQG